MGRAINSQQAALVVYKPAAADDARSSQSYAMATWSLVAETVRNSQEYALVVLEVGPHNPPRNSQEYAIVVWGVTPPGTENRTRAWTYTMDGHLFYVLDLGQEGTFVYDMVTSQWSQFRTEGYVGWNMRVGTTWQDSNRVVAGDVLKGYVWEISPTDLLDEEFRPIEHIVTGGVSTRSRVYIGVEAVRITGSIGQIQDDVEGITTTMRFSDDAGQTWSDDYTVVISPDDFENEIAYRSLGSFMAPGRVFYFSDVGGMLRIDGADLFPEDFDNESELSGG